MLSLYTNCSHMAIVSLWVHALQSPSDSPLLLSPHTKHVAVWAFPCVFLETLLQVYWQNLPLIPTASSAFPFHPLHSATLLLGHNTVSKLTYPKDHLGSLGSLTFVCRVTSWGVWSDSFDSGLAILLTKIIQKHICFSCGSDRMWLSAVFTLLGAFCGLLFGLGGRGWGFLLHYCWDFSEVLFV